LITESEQSYSCLKYFLVGLILTIIKISFLDTAIDMLFFYNCG
jgi:hypothetical protein